MSVPEVEERLTALVADPDLVWGCRDIGKVLGLDVPSTQRLLDRDKLKGAMKIGGRWCASKRELLRLFVAEGQ